MRRLLAMSESQRRQLEKQQQASEEENAALRRRNEEIAQRADSLRREAEAANARLNEALARLKSLVSEITNLRETTRGLVVSLSDVLFDFNRATLRPGAEAKIGQIATILKQYPDHKISVEGHTDSIGSNAYNQRLSEQRAAAVAKALVAGGVEASMISSRGFGRTQPVASNKTAEGRQQNRRVEIVVLGAGTLADAERARADSVARARSGGKPAAGADSSTRRPPE
jgi:outer membrane protein OmpA-like peptidoglycan-associated protein